MVGESSLALLQARSVSKHFGGVEVLADVSFDIKAGDFIVLRGANGSGKTTLLNILSGLLTPDCGRITLHPNGKRAVSFEFEQRGVRSGRNGPFSLGAMARNGVLRSWQDVRLFASLSLLENLNVAAPGDAGERLMSALFRRRAVHESERTVSLASMEILSSFGLDHLVGGNGAGRPSAARERLNGGRAAAGSAVSLGEAKRVAMARACRGDASLLLLDEPLSGLDARGIDSVAALLRVLNREHGLAMLVVEHESTVAHLTELATMVWTLEDGRIVPDRDARPLASEAAFLERWKRAVTREGESAATVSLPQGARLTVIAPADAPEQAAGLTVQELHILRGGRPVLPPVSFRVPRGGVGILEAPNGWGKTSLVEALAGLLPVDSGGILVDGLSLGKEEAWRRREQGLTLLQSRGLSFPKLKVREALEVCGVRTRPPYLASFLGRTVSSLSGGERQRLLFACSQGGRAPRLLLWDEPFLGLDSDGVELLTQTILRRAPDQTFLVLLPALVHDVEEEASEES